MSQITPPGSFFWKPALKLYVLGTWPLAACAFNPDGASRALFGSRSCSRPKLMFGVNVVGGFEISANEMLPS